jgi:hypothetical protein
MNSPTFSSNVRRLVRTAIFASLSLFAVTAAQAAGIKSERLLATIIKQTPESTIVPAGEQMKRAEAAAAEIQGASAFWGVGRSMEPLYTSKTAIVIAPVKYKELKKGMTVVYMNSRGRMVAHSLIGDLPKGWIAQGVGNAEEDDDLVTKDNLVGVIIGAYAEAHSELRVALTKDLVAKGRLVASRT